MLKTKQAFTMIELIFVIVIIGILGAVAIPKLNATRYDAKVAKIVVNTKQLLQDIHTFYTSQGKSGYISNATKIGMITNVPLHLDSGCSNPRPEQKWYGKTMYMCEDSIPVLKITMTNNINLLRQSIFFKRNPLNKTDPIISELNNNDKFKALTKPDIGHSEKEYIITGIKVKR